MVSKADLAVEDWVDIWFEIQGELGAEVNWHLGWTDPLNDQPTWISLDHRKVDGVGGFSNVLKNDGWPVQTVPALSKAKKPRALRMILEFIRQEIGRKSLKPVRWKEVTGIKGTSGMERFVHGFDEPGTRLVLANAKAAGVSANTFLLYHLNRSVQKYLLVDPGENIWVVPVNLRGPLIRKAFSSNHVSFFPVKIKPMDDVGKVGLSYRESIDRNVHWVSWYFINLIGKWFGRKGVYKVVKENLESQQGLVGIFTNLGVWPSPGTDDAMKRHADQVADAKTWFVSANNTPAVPVGAGAATWFGRLGVLVQIHPMVAGNQTIGGEILKDWVNRLTAVHR